MVLSFPNFICRAWFSKICIWKLIFIGAYYHTHRLGQRCYLQLWRGETNKFLNVIINAWMQNCLYLVLHSVYSFEVYERLNMLHCQMFLSSNLPTCKTLLWRTENIEVEKIFVQTIQNIAQTFGLVFCMDFKLEYMW